MSSLQISRGFHRLGIFAALLSFTVCVIIGSNKYDPAGWWIGGIALAAISYGLSRLLGWSVNGFYSSPPEQAVAVAAAPGRIEPSFAAEVSSPRSAATIAMVTAPESRWPKSSDGSPPTIGGWLVLPALSTFLAPLFLLKGMYDLIPAFSALPQLRADLQAFVMVSGVVNLALAVSWAYACYLLANRKRAFPTLFMTLMIVSALVVSADQVASVQLLGSKVDQDGMRDLMRAIVGVVVWVPYMLRSKRVAATFVG